MGKTSARANHRGPTAASGAAAHTGPSGARRIQIGCRPPRRARGRGASGERHRPRSSLSGRCRPPWWMRALPARQWQRLITVGGVGRQGHQSRSGTGLLGRHVRGSKALLPRASRQGRPIDSRGSAESRGPARGDAGHRQRAWREAASGAQDAQARSTRCSSACSLVPRVWPQLSRGGTCRLQLLLMYLMLAEARGILIFVGSEISGRSPSSSSPAKSVGCIAQCRSILSRLRGAAARQWRLGHFARRAPLVASIRRAGGHGRLWTQIFARG